MVFAALACGAIAAFAGILTVSPWTNRLLDVEIVVLVGLAAAALLRGTADDAPLLPAAQPLSPWLVPLVLIGWLSSYRPLILARGVPIMRHDWSWPVDTEELRRIFGTFEANWTAIGIGSPKAYPTLYPFYFVISAAGHVMSSHATLVAFTLVIELGCAAGAYRMCRRMLRTGELAALVAAMFYAFAPFVADKVVAGHLINLVGYAALPWAVLAFETASSAPNGRASVQGAVHCAVLVALSAVQIQYLAFDAIVIGASVLTQAHRRRSLVLALVVLAGALTFHVQSIDHLLHPHGADAATRVSTPDWLEQLSSQPDRALAMDSYAGGYAKNAYPAWLPAWTRLLIVPGTLLFLAGSLLWERRRALAFGLVGVLGLIGLTGMEGPFPAARWALFARIPELGIFREFYNFEALVVFGLTGATALVVHHMPGRRPRGLVALAACALLGVQESPMASGRAVDQLTAWSPTPAYAGLATILGDDGARIAMLPLTAPLRFQDNAWGGSDPFFGGFRGHPTFFEWSAEPVGATLATLSYDDPAAFATLAAAAGVEYVVARSDVRSALAQYWHPELFPKDWAQPDYRRYRLPLFVPVARDAATVVMRNRDYTGLVRLGTSMLRCVDPSPLADVVRGGCRLPERGVPTGRLADGIITATLLPSGRSHDPLDAWVRPAALFFTGLPFAEAPLGALVTLGANSFSFKVQARTSDARLVLRCSSADGLIVYVDGVRHAHDVCRGSTTQPPRIAELGALSPGSHSIVVVNSGGLALVQAAASVRAGLPSASAFGFLASFPLGGSTVQYTRIAPTALDGKFRAPTSGTLLFSDAYDQFWSLSVDGGAWQAPLRVNGFENGYRVSRGEHRFRLRYRNGWFDNALAAIQLAMWPVALLVYLLVRFSPRLRHAGGV